MVSLLIQPYDVFLKPENMEKKNKLNYTTYLNINIVVLMVSKSI